MTKKRKNQKEAQRSGFILKRRGKGADEDFADRRKRREADFDPTKGAWYFMEKMNKAIFLWTLLEKIGGATAEEHFNALIDELIERLPQGEEKENLRAIWES